jgi:hypothetical protein
VPDGGGVVAEFVRLALRLDRIVPGLVGAHLGDPALHREVDAEPLTSAEDVLRGAARLVERVPGAGFPAHRAQVLLAQLDAVACTAERLAGRLVPFVEEVRRCLGVPIGPGDEDGYRAAHRELESLLPGPGSLAERLAAHRRRDELPADRVLPAARELAAALRALAHRPYRLPGDESVAFEPVAGAPWAGLHQHRGRHRSVVRVNTGTRLRAGQLVNLVAHEAYPGHHTELCRLQDGPIAAGGQLEHTASLVLSPCSAVSEGLADTGLFALVGPGWGPWAAGVLAGTGVRVDGELVERVDAAMTGLLRVRQDAALLLHDRGAGEEAARRHLRRWLLVDDERAGQMLAFLTHPVWRSYTSTYVEGYLLVREHLGSHPATARTRHAALLGRPTLPAQLTGNSAATPCVAPTTG